MPDLKLDRFFNCCKWLIGLVDLCIGLSIFFAYDRYDSPTYIYIFDSINHYVWGSIYTFLGCLMIFGILSKTAIWRLASSFSAGALLSWSVAFIIAGSFHRSPPTFFVWLLAAFLCALVAVTVQPIVVEKLLVEVEKLQEKVGE